MSRVGEQMAGLGASRQFFPNGLPAPDPGSSEMFSAISQIVPFEVLICRVRGKIALRVSRL